jgi:hypothetical protein
MTAPVGPGRGGGTLLGILVLATLAVFAGATPAQAEAPAGTPAQGPGATQGRLGQVVVIGVPGLRWSDVQASPELTALVNESHVGSISVKAAGPRTCPVDGWLTISAGTRAWGNGPGQECGELPRVVDGRIQDWQAYVDRQGEHHTGAVLGLVGDSGRRLCGFGPGAAVALARSDGTVSGWQPEFDPARLASCSDAVIDAGPLPLREGREEGRAKVADLVRQVRAEGGWVLLVGVSEENADAHQELLVALQLPPDDVPRWLTSGSTRRPGLIQLSDVTATLLHGETGTAPVDGDEITFTGDRHTSAAAVIQDRLDTNARFEYPRPVLLPVVITLVVAQLAALGWFLTTRSRRARRVAVFSLLAEGGFFAAVFLSTVTVWWRWPSPGWSLYLVVLGISVGLAALASAVLRHRAYLGIAVAAYLSLIVDGVLGTPLQLGSMFADGPVIGGRFYGFGNSTFATFAVGALVAAGWAAQHLLDRSRSLAAAAVLAIGAVAILVDGVPGWGTDFGGIIALTPAVLLLAWLTWRGSVSWRALLGIGLAGLLAVSAFAFLDYLRPPEQRSHFGTFVARLLDGDVSDVFVRKLQMSAGYFDTPVGWGMLLAVLAAIGASVLPRKVPSVAYQRFIESVPMARPTLLAMSACGLIGMLLNDAGVTVPAIMVGFALPLLVARLVAHPAPPTVPPENHRVQEKQAQ